MIFLVGGKGLVGSAFARYFKKNKIKFQIITRQNRKKFFGKFANIIIDCNGNGSKRKGNDYPFFDFKTAVESVVENLNKIKFNRYIYISSIYTYPKLKNRNMTIENKKVNYNELSPYGFSKRIAELYVKKFAKNYLIVRLPFLVGPGLKRNSVYDLSHYKKTFNTLSSKINWIHTDTIAKIVMILLSKKISNQTFNIASKNSITVKKIVNLCGLTINQIKKTKKTYEKTLINTDKLKKFVTLPESSVEIKKYINEIESQK